MARPPVTDLGSRALGQGRDDGALPGRDAGRSGPAERGAAAAARAGAAGESRAAGGMGGGTRHRRVLVHASGFKQSPYADVRPPGDDVRDTRAMAGRREREAPRKLWHSSPGSSGR
jgi:error-prone DNA polymerase